MLTNHEASNMMKRAGYQRVTVAEMRDMARRIGYRLEREPAGLARGMSGDCAGMSWMESSLRPVEADTGLSAYNVKARRDGRYEQLREIRRTFFAKGKSCIVTI